MESKRQQKFARVIQKDLGEIFQREGNTYLPNVMITVTKVRATPDLGVVRVFLSFFNAPDTDSAIKAIREKTAEIRYTLGKRIKDQVKTVPQLDFFIDDTNEYVERMDKLFSGIQKADNSTDE